MMPSEMAVGPLAAIIAMALAVAFTRVAGFWLMGHVTVSARVRRMLEALPGAIVVATAAPLAVKGGVPELHRHWRCIRQHDPAAQ